MIEGVKRVRVAGQDLSIASSFREAGPDLLLMLHGLGCAKESYRDAFASPALADYSLCAIDFPGHGASDTLGARSTVDDFADVVVEVARRFPGYRLHLVSHSLGGAVGLTAAPELPVRSFVNIEGNMVPGDCGIVSRRTASQPLDDFVAHGFAEFVEFLRAAPDAASRAWAEWYAVCDPVAVHTVARSLVEISDSSKLLAVFQDLGNASYVHGDRSELGHLLPLLPAGVIHEIAGSGHFPMIDNPAALWDAVGAGISGRVGQRVGVGRRQ